MDWYLKVLKNYTGFAGRARRKDYWMFFLFNFIVSIVLGFLDGMLGTSQSLGGLPLLGGIYLLAILLPSLAVGARRLHDTGKSGWWQLIALVPFVGGIVLLVLFALEGNRGSNAYGPDPKGGEGYAPAA